MHSMLVNKYGDPDILEYTELEPKKINDTSVRIKVSAAGINFADILTI